MLAEFKY